jgi:3-oxoacyl-[acyl-carrier-protein] synthase II
LGTIQKKTTLAENHLGIKNREPLTSLSFSSIKTRRIIHEPLSLEDIFTMSFIQSKPHPLPPEQRVVITGSGVISPLGLDARSTWIAIREGKSGVARITHFDPTPSPVQIAAEVKGFDPVTHCGDRFSIKDLRKVGRFSHFALAAATEAWKQSGLNISEIDPQRIGVQIGVGMGGLPELEDTHNDFLEKGYKRISPFFVTQLIPNLASGLVSMALGLKGPNLCQTTACASSAHAIGEAYLSIRSGMTDRMVAGGAEAVICPMGIGGFAAIRALSSARNENPEEASRPYDADRDGFVMGEGSAVLVLERMDLALARGATILGEIAGYGLSADAYHFTLPSPEGEGGGAAVDQALKMAGISGKDLDYVNTHATSTPAGDLEEAVALSKRVDRNRCHVSSTKSMTGHLLGAAGAIEAFISMEAIRDGFVPPTRNLDEVDPKCAATGLNFTPKKGIEKSIEYALSNSFGFGGTNASLILRKWKN